MDLDVLRTTVCSEAAEFRPELLTPAGATVAVEHWAAIERARTSAKLRFALRVDDAGLYGDGVVADVPGTTPSRARRQKRRPRPRRASPVRWVRVPQRAAVGRADRGDHVGHRGLA